MQKYIFILLAIITICSCSNSNISEFPDQYGGPDLFNSLSAQEKNLLGTWYFAYEIFERNNASDSISIEPSINYGNFEQTDTLRFYSSRFVGFKDYCPYIAPDSLRGILKTCNLFTAYLFNCFPDRFIGWYIEDNILKNYWGNPFESMAIQEIPIVTITNDSLVFIHEAEFNQPNIIYRKPVFYKK